MLRARFSLIVLAFALLTSSPRLFAFDDWQPITKEDLQMKADPANQTDAIILYHEDTLDDLTGHQYIYLRVKVLTEKGKDRGNVEIPFNATQFGIDDIKARTISPDGTITPFTGKAFNSTIVKAHDVKYLAKTFTLPNVQVGSIIEWKYTKYWENVAIAPRWVVQEDLPQKHAKFTFIPYIGPNHDVVDSETGELLNRVYYTVLIPGNATVKTGNDNRMELELKDIPAYEDEDFSPPSSVMEWRVNFYYGTDKMGKTQEFWKNQGKFWSKNADKFAGRSSAVKAAVNQTISPSDTPEQKARKIYAFVQKIKNLDYTHGEEMPSKERPSLDRVLSKQEGFSNEIARLYLSMARTAGLSAYLMRVADRNEVFFEPNIPDRSQLTSEIVIVAIDGKEIFLDPGTPLCPFGLLAWQHNSDQGMRQTADGGTALAQTPVANYKDAASKRVGRLTLSDDGSAKGTIGIAWTGIEALGHRLSGLKTDDAGRKKDLEDELKELLPAGSVVKLDSAKGWDDANAELAATFSVEIPSYASSTGKRLLVPENLFETHGRQPFAHDRHNPVYFAYPYVDVDETHITFPATFHLETIANTQPARTGYSVYQVDHTTTGNTVDISRDFVMGGMAFQQKDYDELRRFYAAVATGDSESLVLTAAN